MKFVKYPTLIITIIVFSIIVNASGSSDFIRRVAVLQFDDHSNFDSPTGCGCLPTWPFNIIFGDKSSGIKWALKPGFQSILIERLDRTDYYQAISLDELLDAMARLNLSEKDLKNSEKNRAKLAEELELDALIVGDIKKFGQERLRGEGSSRYAGSYGNIGGLTGGVSARGYYYSATVEAQLIIYGHSGRPLSEPKVRSKKRYEIGGTKIAPFEAVISSEGTEVKIGNKTITKKVIKPIVDQRKLRQIEFGSEEYKETLLGIVTSGVLEQTIEQLRQSIGPTEQSLTKPPHPVDGKIASVDSEDLSETYINLGSKDEIAAGHRLAVYHSVDIKDPDTDKVLGTTKKKIGLIMVIEVISDRLSRVKILKGSGEIRKGDPVDDKIGE